MLKKSTKIILISSGTVIFIGVILIIVFAYVIKADPPPTTPAPISYPSDRFDPPPQATFNCPSPINNPNFTNEYTDITISGDAKLTPLGNNQYKATINWKYNNVNTFLKQVYGDSLADQSKNYRFNGWVQILPYDESGQSIPVGKTGWGSSISPSQNSYTETITLSQEAKQIKFSVKISLCWKQKGYAVTRPVHLGTSSFDSQLITPDPNKETTTTIDTPGTLNAPPPASGSGSGICDCGSGGLYRAAKGELMDYISCKVKCGILDGVIMAVKWAYNVMINGSGLGQVDIIPAPINSSQ